LLFDISDATGGKDESRGVFPKAAQQCRLVENMFHGFETKGNVKFFLGQLALDIHDFDRQARRTAECRLGLADSHAKDFASQFISKHPSRPSPTASYIENRGTRGNVRIEIPDGLFLAGFQVLVPFEKAKVVVETVTQDCSPLIYAFS